jgi:hypothetical protein
MQAGGRAPLKNQASGRPFGNMNEETIWVRLALAALATWRVTHLLANEDGPADVIFRLRRRLGKSLIGSLMDCFNCLSLWIAAPAALFVSTEPLTWAFSWLALSGGACLLERLGAPADAAPQGMEQIMKKDDDVLR